MSDPLDDLFIDSNTRDHMIQERQQHHRWPRCSVCNKETPKAWARHTTTRLCKSCFKKGYRIDKTGRVYVDVDAAHKSV
jgi:hypothetical protein